LPGSVHAGAWTNTIALAVGAWSKNADVFVNNSPVFKLGPEMHLLESSARSRGSFPAFASKRVLGQQYLDGGVAIAERSVGEELYLFDLKHESRAAARHVQVFVSSMRLLRSASK